MEKIIGLINAPFTPFHADGSVNFDPIPTYAALYKLLNVFFELDIFKDRKTKEIGEIILWILWVKN